MRDMKRLVLSSSSFSLSLFLTFFLLLRFISVTTITSINTRKQADKINTNESKMSCATPKADRVLFFFFQFLSMLLVVFAFLTPLMQGKDVGHSPTMGSVQSGYCVTIMGIEENCVDVFHLPGSGHVSEYPYRSLEKEVEDVMQNGHYHSGYYYYESAPMGMACELQGDLIIGAFISSMTIIALSALLFFGTLFAFACFGEPCCCSCSGCSCSCTLAGFAVLPTLLLLIDWVMVLVAYSMDLCDGDGLLSEHFYLAPGFFCLVGAFLSELIGMIILMCGCCGSQDDEDCRDDEEGISNNTGKGELGLECNPLKPQVAEISELTPQTVGLNSADQQEEERVLVAEQNPAKV